MMVSALAILGKHVVLSDGAKLGRIENFVINRLTHEVDLVVFPSIPPKLIRTHAGNVVGMVTSQAIGRLKDFVPVDFLGPVTDSISGQVGGIAATDARKRIRVIEEAYYLVPTYFVVASATEDDNDDSVHVRLDLKDIKEWFATPILPAETYTAFLDASYYKGQKRSVEITVGLPSAIGSLARVDDNGQEFQIKDLKIEIPPGTGSFQP